jgi:hypothetical protein
MADTFPQSGKPGNSRIVLHTPGPWTANGCRVLASPPGWQDIDIGFALDNYPTKRAAQANARLMAASPALLGAVVALVFAVMDDDPAVMAQALRQAVGALVLVEGSQA